MAKTPAKTIFLAPDTPFTHELYYRSDGVRLDRALKGGHVVQVFYGLRRYGKTWFLRNVEHKCSQLPAKSRPKTMFIDVPGGSPRELAGEIAAFRSALEDSEKGQFVLLIDDLQKIDDKRAPSEDKQMFASQLGSFVRTAERLERERGRLQARVVFCEPTNLLDWLESGEEDCCGPLFHELLRKHVTFNAENILPPIKTEGGRDSEAHRLFSGVVGDITRVEGVDPLLSERLAKALGGNPWLMAYACEIIRTPLTRLADFTTIYDQTRENVIHNPQELAKLDTIYGSLSRREKLMLRLVYDADCRREHTRELLGRTDDETWKAAGLAVADRLPRLGLVTGELGPNGMHLTPFLKHYFREHLRGYDTYGAPTAEDREVWSEILFVDPPHSERSGKVIVHQMSDLFLGQESDPQWEAYLEKLAKFKVAAKSEDKASRIDRRPDLLIVCGNIIATPCAEGSGSGMCEQRYLEALKAAEANLRRVLPNLRPGANETTASPKQIVLLPGVFDLDWACEDADDGASEGYRRKWELIFKDFTLAGQPADFESFGVTVLPFDTTSLSGAREHGGKGTVRDLRSVRARLQSEFSKDWELLVESTVDKPSGRAAAERLASLTFGYVLDVTDDRAAYDRITDPTFKWRGSLADRVELDGEPRSYLCDTGFVSEAQTHWTGVTEANSRERLRIAVTHHHPDNYRRAGVIEFFNERQFRQRLASTAVQAILHGRSSDQQLVRQRVSYMDRGSKGGERIRSTTIDVISSGRFAAGSLVYEGGEVGFNVSNPSFNELEFDREKKKDGQASVKVTFWEYEAGAWVERPALGGELSS